MSSDIAPWLDGQWAQCVQSIEAGRLGHALLIAGPHGLGQRILADRLMAYLVCERPKDAMPCLDCKGCRLFGSGAHPDAHMCVPDSASNRISINQIRDLSDHLAITPRQALLRVALLEPADAMTIEAANALLKTLEEPSGQRVMILVSASSSRLPKTIRSRCRPIILTPPSLKVFSSSVEALGLSAPDMSALYAACEGAPLRAKDQLSEGHADRQKHVLDWMLATDPVVWMDGIRQIKPDETEVELLALIQILSQCLRIKQGVAVSGIDVGHTDQLTRAVEEMSLGRIKAVLGRCLKRLDVLRSGLRLNSVMLFEMLYLALNGQAQLLEDDDAY